MSENELPSVFEYNKTFLAFSITLRTNPEFILFSHVITNNSDIYLLDIICSGVIFRCVIKIMETSPIKRDPKFAITPYVLISASLCSLQPHCHLLGKGWPLCSLVCCVFLCFCHSPICVLIHIQN